MNVLKDKGFSELNEWNNFTYIGLRFRFQHPSYSLCYSGLADYQAWKFKVTTYLIQSSLFGDLTGHDIEDGEVNTFMDFHVTFHEGRTCGNTPRRFMLLEPTCR